MNATPVRLLFDLAATQPNGSGRRHGGGKYGEALFFRLLERGIAFSCFYDSRLWLHPQVEELCRRHAVPLFDLARLPLQEVVDRNRFDTLYSCLPERCHGITGCRLVGTLHDLRDLEIPLDTYAFRYACPPRERLRFILKKALAPYYRSRKYRYFRDAYLRSGMEVVTVSDYTAEAIGRHYPEAAGRIPVFYSPATSREDFSGAPLPPRTLSGERYLLLVSANRWEKNALRAALAFDALRSQGHFEGVKMHLLGATEGVFKARFRHPEDFVYFGYVSEEELQRQYAGAWMFLYPSLSEGFGYPPLEAMRYGVPVLSSRATSMPEILGGAALFFDPFSIDEIRDGLLLMAEPERYARFSEAGPVRFRTVLERQNRDLDALIDHILSPRRP